MTLKQLISRENRILRRHRRVRGLLKRKLRHERRVLAVRKSSQGFMWVDGVRVCGWIAAELATARAYGWKGRVVSGYRTPAHSQALCYAMCGRPSCPGRCAGTSSNHTRGPKFPLGAVDVTDYSNLQRICDRHNLRIHNALPADRVHFSNGGR